MSVLPAAQRLRACSSSPQSKPTSAAYSVGGDGVVAVVVVFG
jgi:hypothetical protein